RRAMNDALPAELEVVATADRARYVLPRPPGVPGCIGPLLIGFGLFPLVMGVVFIVLTLRVLAAPFPFNLAIVPLLIVPSAFVLIGLALIFLGAFFLAGRTEVELTGDALSAAMRVGPFRWRGRRRRGQVLRLTVEYPRGPDEAAQAAGS